MRIVLVGQSAFCEKVFEGLIASGEEVVAVYAPPDVSPGKTSTLVALAAAHGIPTRQPEQMRGLGVIDDYRSFDAELNVVACVTEPLPAEMVDHPPLGTIQYHPSLLPRHRGPSPINWAIIRGETKTGLTVFWPDEGLDTGPILLQKEVEISPDETMGDVYFNKLFPLGVESVLEAVKLVGQGKAPRESQDPGQGEYEPECLAMSIDWMYPIEIVFNVVRGCNPSPGAWTTYKGHRLRIFDCEKRSSSGRQTPGTVVQINGDGFLVAGNGGSIFVQRVQPESTTHLDVEEFTNTYGVRVGDRLG